MNPQITIDYGRVIEKVRQMLSIYAKRAKDKSGGMQFQDFTLSSAEEVACKVYTQYAVNGVISDILQFVQGVSKTREGVVFRARNTRWQSDSDEDFQTSLTEHIVTFAALVTLSKLFQGLMPSLVKVTEEDAMAAKRDIHDMFFFKYAPGASDKEPEDVSAVVSNAPT